MTNTENDFVLHPPFNVVRKLSARMGTMTDGSRVLVLEFRYMTPPEEVEQEVTLLLDVDLTSKLEARLTELSRRGSPNHH